MASISVEISIEMHERKVTRPGSRKLAVVLPFVFRESITILATRKMSHKVEHAVDKHYAVDGA